MKWKLVADSGATISPDLFAGTDVAFELVPLMINIGTQVYVDDANLDMATFVKDMQDSKEASSTACPSPQAYANAFEGAANVICFTISSGLSGSYNSAQLGRNMALEENPLANIYIFDCLSAGTENDLLIAKGLELVKSGLDFDQVVASLKDYHQKTDVVFILESVDNLVKAGRVNRLVGGMIGLLGIRLIGVRTAEGKIEIGAKSKGSKRAVKATVEEMLKHGYQGGKVAISHSDNPEVVEAVSALLREHYPQAQIEVVDFNGLCTFYAQYHGLIIGFEKA